MNTVANPLSNSPIITIKNDVWIGQNVVLKAGITVGNGAVIASNSVVIKDVPDYAIVGGVPAKVIRYRFDDIVIQSLLGLKWWDYSCLDFADIPMDVSIDRFIDEMSSQIEEGQLQAYSPIPIIL